MSNETIPDGARIAYLICGADDRKIVSGIVTVGQDMPMMPFRCRMVGGRLLVNCRADVVPTGEHTTLYIALAQRMPDGAEYVRFPGMAPIAFVGACTLNARPSEWTYPTKEWRSAQPEADTPVVVDTPSD